MKRKGKEKRRKTVTKTREEGKRKETEEGKEERDMQKVQGW